MQLTKSLLAAFLCTTLICSGFFSSIKNFFHDELVELVTIKNACNKQIDVMVSTMRYGRLGTKKIDRGITEMLYVRESIREDLHAEEDPPLCIALKTDIGKVGESFFLYLGHPTYFTVGDTIEVYDNEIKIIKPQ